MSSTLNSLSAAQLKRAVAIKEEIEKLEMELSGIGGESPQAAPFAAPVEVLKKRTMSAAAKAKISAAQKARWAKERGGPAPETATRPAAKAEKTPRAAALSKINAGSEPRGKTRKANLPLNDAVSKPKRHLSAAGRANIIAATKARWAKYNAAKKAR